MLFIEFGDISRLLTCFSSQASGYWQSTTMNFPMNSPRKSPNNVVNRPTCQCSCVKASVAACYDRSD